MHNLRKYIRVVSAFLLINFLYATFIPTISYALTSGPTAPEATSFEPIDTTDMVNLQTGDFTYNIPLLEVPGPSGGYPLSLSYHAGALHNQEASWVGLGWTLNPGAVNRAVNGFADDHSGETVTDRFYWEGGERKAFNAGVSLGKAGQSSVGFGLSVSHDTYKGYGAGFYAKAGQAKLGYDSQGGINASFTLKGVAVSVNSQGVSANTNVGLIGIGVSAGEQGFNASATVSALGATVMTSLKDPKPSLVAFAGVPIQTHNSNSGIVTDDWYTLDLQMDIGFVSLGYEYTRYFINQMDFTNTSGALYYPTIDQKFPEYIDQDHLDGHAFDTYSIYDGSQVSASNNNPENVLGGTFPNYDNFQVVGQGIGGNIRPYLLRQHLLRQNIKEGDDYLVKHYLTAGTQPLSAGGTFKRPSFRYINDFSNRHQYDPANFNKSGESWNGPLGYDFDWADGPNIGDNQIQGIVESHLAGSRHVEYLTNDQIHQIKEGNKVNDVGFIETKSSGFDFRSETALEYDQTTGTFIPAGDFDEQIGALIITNETGMKYHFALPVYTKNEYSYSENTENEGTYNETKRPSSYAYTWLLTAITGPDFVDRGGVDEIGNGEFDENDWGYWVEFDYGKWTDQYRWRNPAQGFHEDLDSKFQNISEGTKEVYYLDAIKTKSHTALFLKDIRNDAKSVIKVHRNRATTLDHNLVNLEDDLPAWKEDLLPEGREGGFIPKQIHNEYYHFFDGNLTATIDYTAKPVSTLKLDRIVLLKNEELEALSPDKSIGTELSQSVDYDVHIVFGNNSYTETEVQHNPENVYDIYDFDLASIDASKTIILDTDYSLQQGIPNSFVSDLLNQNNPPTNAQNYSLTGKLTLNSLIIEGRNNNRSIPPTNFYYNHSESTDFDKDAHDIWGFYKSDYDPTQNGLKEAVTLESSNNIKTNMLSGIQTNTGARVEINYESDSYSQSVLNENYSFLAEQVEYESPNVTRITILNDNYFESIPNQSDIGLCLAYREVTYFVGDNCGSAETQYNGIQFLTKEFDNASIADGVITIIDSELYDIVSFDDFDPSGIGQGDCEEFHRNSLINANLAIEELEKLGGGLRVKKIETREPITNRIVSSNYEYNDGNVSSGVTSYEPSFFKNFKLLSGGNDAKEKLTTRLQTKFGNLFALSGLAPAPGTMYRKVSITNSVTNSNQEYVEFPSRTEYIFETFQPGMSGIHEISNFSESTDNERLFGDQVYHRLKHRALAFKDYSSRVGNLKSLTVYDQSNNKLSETVNQYLHDQVSTESLNQNINNYEPLINSKYLDQGVIEETFVDARFVKQDNSTYHLLGAISKFEEFPSIQTGQTITNYKTGITTTTENLAFDFYSGAVTKTRSMDGNGNSFESETVPAYRKYGGIDGMGLAINGGKNMLTQTAANYTWKVNPADGTKQSLIAADIQTWNDHWAYKGADGLEANTAASDQHPVWRKHESYSYTGGQSNLKTNDDGLVIYDPATFQDFDHWAAIGAEPGSEWQKNSEVTLYDRYSHALEAIDVNGNYAATKMDGDQEKVLSTVANAAYDEFAYSGAEDTESGGYFGGAVTKGASATKYTTTTDNDANVHTGWASLSAAAGAKAFGFTATAKATRHLKVSTWASQSDAVIKYKLNGGAEQSLTPTVRQADSWHLLTAFLPAINANDQLEVWCESGGSTTYFDDFRVHPIDAPMTAYVYNAYDELAFILDNNNLYTEYKYDDMGRLERTYRESFKYGRTKVSEYEIKYAKHTN